MTAKTNRMLTSTTDTNWRCSRLLLLPLVLLMCTGCGQSQGAQTSTVVDENTPSSRPSAEDMMKANSPDYKSPVGMRQECFGRMLFDVATSVEWPTFYEGAASLFYRGFSPKVQDRGDEMTYDDTKIAVIGPATSQTLEEVMDGTPSGIIKFLHDAVADKRAYIDRLKNEELTEEKKKCRATRCRRPYSGVGESDQ